MREHEHGAFSRVVASRPVTGTNAARRDGDHQGTCSTARRPPASADRMWSRVSRGDASRGHPAMDDLVAIAGNHDSPSAARCGVGGVARARASTWSAGCRALQPARSTSIGLLIPVASAGAAWSRRCRSCAADRHLYRRPRPVPGRQHRAEGRWFERWSRSARGGLRRGRRRGARAAEHWSRR